MDESHGARVGPVPPPAYYAAGFVLGLLADRLAPARIPGRTPRRVLGGLLTAAGAAVLATAARSMKRHQTTIVPHQPVSALITTGLHAHSRNPIYTGLVGIHAGAALLVGSWWPLAALPAVVGQVRRRVIEPEEAYLSERFPDDYPAYRARVRRWL
jgi:protein-S-isoprenylcysteine O-methyltransferase Ste14